MSNTTSGGPRTETQNQGGKLGSTGPAPTAANKDAGGKHATPHEDQCSHHGHSTLGIDPTPALAHQKGPGEDEYGVKPPESHEFAEQKPGHKNLLGEWIEGFKKG